MIRAKLFVVCESASIDSRTNSVSAFHIMDQLNAMAFPVVLPHVSIIALFAREDADASNVQFQLQIFLEDQQLFGGPLRVNFVQQLLARTVLDMHGLLLTRPGTLRFVLRNGDEMLGSWTALVTQVGQPGFQMAFPPPPPQPAHG